MVVEPWRLQHVRVGCKLRCTELNHPCTLQTQRALRQLGRLCPYSHRCACLYVCTQAHVYDPTDNIMCTSSTTCTKPLIYRSTCHLSPWPTACAQCPPTPCLTACAQCSPTPCSTPCAQCLMTPSLPPACSPSTCTATTRTGEPPCGLQSSTTPQPCPLAQQHLLSVPRPHPYHLQASPAKPSICTATTRTGEPPCASQSSTTPQPCQTFSSHRCADAASACPDRLHDRNCDGSAVGRWAGADPTRSI